MGWGMPWYSAQDSLDTLMVGRRVGMMHVVCYLRQGSNVSRLTTRRSVEAMDNSYLLLDLPVYGRQETWEDSPTGWPQRFKGKQHIRIDGRPAAQWVSPEGRVFGRPGNRQALNRAYHFLDLRPDATPRWRGCADTIGIGSFSEPRSS
jgi:hypothetical protein